MDINQTTTQRLYNTSYQPKSIPYVMDVGPRTDVGRKIIRGVLQIFDMYWFHHIFELSDKHCILFCRTCFKGLFDVFYLLNNQRNINLSVFTWFTYSPCKRFYCFSFISNSLVICLPLFMSVSTDFMQRPWCNPHDKCWGVPLINDNSECMI